MKNKLLFVNQTQFGYHIDYLQYCKYLKQDFDITFLCWDYNLKKINESDINIHYVNRRGNIIIRNLRFIKYVLNSIKSQPFNFVFIHYFRGVSFISLLSKKKQALHLDIRTGFISPNYINRTFNNAILSIESLFFKSISIISIGLRNKLHIKESAFILPLGASQIYVEHHNKIKLHLLYVGTFTNRNLKDTIDGFYQFLKNQTHKDFYYTIVGNGWKDEKKELENKINELGLQKNINLTGYVPYNELLQYYEIANVGVSYIPITPYYEFQPATKTFEYLMAGMPVIATQTYENKEVINQTNGVLISDNPQSFANGISQIYNTMDIFDKKKIKQSVEKHEWCTIIQKMKEEILS